MGENSLWSCVLWDLDGTILDDSAGILGRLRIAHEHLGMTPPTEADLIHWIGPPMFESFQRNAGLTPEEAAAAVTFYRSLNTPDSIGVGARLFDGVPELIRELNALGVPQAIASSKPETQVLPLTVHFGIDTDFVARVGATDDERSLANKADVVREALRLLEAAGADVSRPVLIGDRHHDVEGGAEHGVPVIFVGWGFGEATEADGAIAVAHTVDELRHLVVRES